MLLPHYIDNTLADMTSYDIENWDDIITMYFPPCSNFYEVTAQTHVRWIDVLGHQDVWQEWNRENWDVMEWIGWWPKDPGRFNHVATTSTLTWWCDFEQSHGKFPDSATLPWNIQKYVAFWCILEVNLWVSCRWLCSYTSSLKSLHLSRSSCFRDVFRGPCHLE